MTLALSRAHFPIRTLGPGARLGIWFQGCSIRCPGCISMDTWDGKQGATSVDALLESIAPWVAEAEGITISGGEPFDQERALHSLLLRLRELSSVDVFVYSGHPWEYLAPLVGPGGRFEGLLDALMTDPFLTEAPQTRALRGSDNQRLHFLSPLGKERFQAYERDLAPGEAALDLMAGEDGDVWMAGIPRRGDLRKLSAYLGTGGHSVITSEASVPVRSAPLSRLGLVVPP